MKPSVTNVLFDHTPLLDFLQVLKLEQVREMPILPTLLENTPSLTCFSMNDSDCITDEVISALEKHPTITNLSLVRCKITGDYAERLLLNPNLKVLNLKFNDATLSDGVDFALCNRNLEYLKLDNNESLPQSSIERIIRNHTSLKSLSFHGIRCSKTILDALCENQSLTDVCCSIKRTLDESDLQRVLDSCPNLIKLRIHDQLYFSDSDSCSGSDDDRNFW
jgi:uncharacterized protein YejL (UPF0352 family)